MVGLARLIVLALEDGPLGRRLFSLPALHRLFAMVHILGYLAWRSGIVSLLRSM